MRTTTGLMQVSKQSSPGVAALREAMRDVLSEVPRVWMEVLEPRVMFAATAATLALDRGFGVGGFLPGAVYDVAAGLHGDWHALIAPKNDEAYDLVHFNVDGV